MGNTRRGGKRVGQGTTAFIVDPPIPCEGESGPRKGFVTKVTTIRPQDWKVNPVVLAKLKQLDPEQKYFYYPVDCVPGTLTKENKEDGITEELKPFTELMAYAPGGTWLNATYRPRTWKEWIDGRNEEVLASSAPRTDQQKQHLVNAVTLLHQNNIAHGDLHHENIVIAEDGLPRLIDFARARFQERRTRPFNTEIELENETLKDLYDEKIVATSRRRKMTRRNKASSKALYRRGSRSRNGSSKTNRSSYGLRGY
jgi:predicted Ser/Thr protein kinase